LTGTVQILYLLRIVAAYHDVYLFATEGRSDMMTYSRLPAIGSCSRFDVAQFLLFLRSNLSRVCNNERLLNARSVTIRQTFLPTPCPPHYSRPRSPDCPRRWAKTKRLAPSLRAAFLPSTTDY
jgi:hypothetical protein